MNHDRESSALYRNFTIAGPTSPLPLARRQPVNRPQLSLNCHPPSRSQPLYRSDSNLIAAEILPSPNSPGAIFGPESVELSARSLQEATQLTQTLQQQRPLPLVPEIDIHNASNSEVSDSLNDKKSPRNKPPCRSLSPNIDSAIDNNSPSSGNSEKDSIEVVTPDTYHQRLQVFHENSELGRKWNPGQNVTLYADD